MNISKTIPPPAKTCLIGFAGKRDLSCGFVSQSAGAVALAAALDVAFAREETADGGNTDLVGICALAKGADTVFAEQLLFRGGRLRIILPDKADDFFNISDFDNTATLERSKSLQRHSNVEEVHIIEDDPMAFQSISPRVRRFALCARAIILMWPLA